VVEQPGQLRVLGDVRLDEHGADVRVQPGREQDGRHLQGPVGQLPGVIGQGDGVQVDHRVEGLEVVLHVHPLPEGAHVVAEVGVRRTYRAELRLVNARSGARLDAREDAGPRLLVHYSPFPSCERAYVARA